MTSRARKKKGRLELRNRNNHASDPFYMLSLQRPCCQHHSILVLVCLQYGHFELYIHQCWCWEGHYGQEDTKPSWSEYTCGHSDLLGVQQSRNRDRSALLRGIEGVGARAQAPLKRLQWAEVKSVTVADLCHTCSLRALLFGLNATVLQQRWSHGWAAGCFRQACERRPLALYISPGHSPMQ